MKDADFVINEIITAQDADPFDDEATTDALTDALNLIVEQRNLIGTLERALEHMPKPVKLLDVFGDKYEKIVRCKDCKYYPSSEGSTKWLPCSETITAPDWFCADGERKSADEKLTDEMDVKWK